MGIEKDMKNIRKLNIHDVEPDPHLGSDLGCHRMELQWLIDEEMGGAKFGALGHTIFNVGSEHEAHVHKNAEEYIIIVKGHGLHTTGKEEFEVGPGDILFVPQREVHETKNASNTEPLELYFVYAGAPSFGTSGYSLHRQNEHPRAKPRA